MIIVVKKHLSSGVLQSSSVTASLMSLMNKRQPLTIPMTLIGGVRRKVWLHLHSEPSTVHSTACLHASSIRLIRVQPQRTAGLIILSSFISGRINNIRGPITVVIYSVSDMHACCVTRFWLQRNPRGPNRVLWGIPVIFQSRIKQSNKTSQWNDPCVVITQNPPSWVPIQSLSTLYK